MDNSADAQGQPRRPRLVLPGAGEAPPRPKIVLPGHGLIDPSAPPLAEPAPVIAEIQEAETIGSETGVLIKEEPVLEPDAILIEESVEQADTPDEFLAEVSPDASPEATAPPVEAEPADFKTVAPVRLGPPVGWVPPEFADQPELPAPIIPEELSAEPLRVPAWKPVMPVFQAAPPDEPEPFLGEAPDPDAQAEYDAQTGWPEPEEYPASEPPEAPMAEPIPLAHVPSSRIPKSLTSRHPIRPGTHQVPLHGAPRHHAPTSHQPQPHHATAPHPHAGHAPQAAHPLPHKPAVQPSERLLPGWLLVLSGILLGIIVGIFGIARTPLADKLGLTNRTEAAAYAANLLKEERTQVQSMLDSYYEREKIDLAGEMAEFRTETGRKLPEKMTAEELRQSGKPKDAEADKKDETENAEKPADANQPEAPKADEPQK